MGYWNIVRNTVDALIVKDNGGLDIVKDELSRQLSMAEPSYSTCSTWNSLFTDVLYELEKRKELAHTLTK